MAQPNYSFEKRRKQLEKEKKKEEKERRKAERKAQEKAGIIPKREDEITEPPPL